MLDGAPFYPRAAHLTRCVHLPSVTSTMDHAHELAAAGAHSGTLVLADVQTSGRGRAGKTWVSEAGQGLWCTLIERAPSVEALSVLSLRVGLAVAEVAEQWCTLPVQLKWPNDVLVREEAGLSKLCGVLVEARWRETAVEWVAIGIGVNLRCPVQRTAARDADIFRAAYLTSPVSRAEVLTQLMPRVREACCMGGVLSDAEHRAWSARDATRGQTCVQPDVGVVDGIDNDGALRVLTANGSVRTHRSGSLILSGEPASC
jgi:BirA family biotin operon repressor/biotin-[acetyl-CoA-carboxylase] ligase